MSTRPAPRVPAPRVDLLSAEGLAEHDVQQVTSLLGRLVDGGAALGWVSAPATAEIGELVERLAAGTVAGEAAAAIARSGDEITGFAFWHRYTRPTFRPHVDIEKVAVAPEAQGRGVGKGLMEALIRAAHRRGTEVITLDLRGDNAAAIGLYESLGFTRYGRLPDFVAVGQERFDTLLYSLDLRR
ncbi:Ribosomal protein S18 acetylase RimI [Brevibacterium siliguriense]|uniref:Ribosomal protein S18 acetylase RimI n=1 Tax=Brevibacterium siliguriense TaxID=1136497 RepID=A0A1H1TYM9_9MICO|nr:GNAT family N-acetyltransferase [Brevibacterium siliguriense]SDS65342.1 Ribosomal protein S18 acetylase RimI [Brevibacterium siliguriense]